jgi:hypothetical protein
VTYPLAHFIQLPELRLPSEILHIKPFGLSEAALDDATSVLLPNIILGKQGEFLFSETIKATTNFTLLAANIQVNDEKRTIGELDYIVKNCSSNQVFHVELACKFYLLKEDEHATIEGQWIGPNLKDTLLDKLQKFSESQFPLLRHPATKTILSGLGISENILQRYCVKAMLFVPETFSKKLPLHYQNCVKGIWIKHGDLILKPKATYGIPSKREWLLAPEKISTWYTSDAISETIKEQIALKKSPLIYENLEGCITVFFVVWWE